SPGPKDRFEVVALVDLDEAHAARLEIVDARQMDSAPAPAREPQQWKGIELLGKRRIQRDAPAGAQAELAIDMMRDELRAAKPLGWRDRPTPCAHFGPQSLAIRTALGKRTHLLRVRLAECSQWER